MKNKYSVLILLLSLLCFNNNAISQSANPTIDSLSSDSVCTSSDLVLVGTNLDLIDTLWFIINIPDTVFISSNDFESQNSSEIRLNLADSLYNGSWTIFNTTQGIYSILYNTPLTVFDNISLSSLSVETLNCNGDIDGEITLDPAGGSGSYLYLWDNSDTSHTISGLSAGTYSVAITDSILGNICFLDTSFTINDPPALIASTSVTDLLCNADGSGTVTVLGTGGTPDPLIASGYTYQWSDANAQTTATATGLQAGTYTVIVTDSNGCSTVDAVTINEPTLLTSSTTVQDADCFGAATGSATVIGSGGTLNYSYQWDSLAGNVMTSTASNLTAGTYSVTVTDDNGCVSDTSIIISEPDILEINEEPSTNLMACIGSGVKGEISVSISGGTGDYTYNWSNGDDEGSIYSLDDGEYTITVTDNNDCDVSKTFFVDAFPELKISFFEKDSTIILSNFGNEVNLNVNINLDSSSIIWKREDALLSDFYNKTSLSYEETTEGDFTYKVEVESNDGCVETESIKLTVKSLELNGESVDIVVPNAFSPNDNGENDILRPLYNLNEINNVNLLVFDIYGQKVFECNNCELEMGWDGTVNGIKQPVGIYRYLLTYQIKESGEQLRKMGEVTLIR